MVRLAQCMGLMATITTPVMARGRLSTRPISIPGLPGLKQDLSHPTNSDWSCGAASPPHYTCDEPGLKPQDCVMLAGDMFDSFVNLPDGKLTIKVDSCEQYVRGDCQTTVCNVGQDVQVVDIRATAMKVMNPMVIRCVVNQKRGQWQDGNGILVDVRSSQSAEV